MGIKINITKINKDAGFISFTQGGESKTAEITLPARVEYAKIGESEVGFNQDGKINFVKSLNYNQSADTSQKEKKYKVYNEVEISERITLKEFKQIYNDMSKNMKINATNIINDGIVDGKFLVDVIFFRTRFEKINNVSSTGTSAMIDETQTI